MHFNAHQSAVLRMNPLNENHKINTATRAFCENVRTGKLQVFFVLMAVLNVSAITVFVFKFAIREAFILTENPANTDMSFCCLFYAR